MTDAHLPDDRVSPTRGPWCVEAAMSNRALDIALDYEIPEAGNPIIIGSSYSDEGENPLQAGYISHAEAEANARLMAAAPELLKALKDLLRDEKLDDGDERLGRSRAQAAIAIDKAEGRSRG